MNSKNGINTIFIMKKNIILFLLILLSASVNAQIRLKGYNGDKINPSLLTNRWNAYWISIQNPPRSNYGIYHFRKSFNLQNSPETFIIHVSADNRYKFYVNGELVSLGPARCDINNWNFETIDIAPYLQKGKNTLAAVVWNYSDQKPLAQISLNEAALIVQGNSEAESVINTNSSWLYYKNTAYEPYRNYVTASGTVVGPGELFKSDKYPWGWEAKEYDDSSWTKAKQTKIGAIKGTTDYFGRLLVPTPIPPMEYKPEYFSSVKQSEGIQCSKKFIEGKEVLIIPARSKVHLILDQEYLTTGYLSFQYAKGKEAEITIGYAEAFFIGSPRKMEKGNRNDIKGKEFAGYKDKVIADGGINRRFLSLWWRTWRYVDIEIETKDEELRIDNLHSIYTGYPFVNKTSFTVPKEYHYLNKILDIGWRTARLCAHETYMDCPYYEQLQYFGDTRIQTMITLFNTDDTCMVRNAIEQGRQSMSAEGITMSRYPTDRYQYIPNFSLWWIGIGYDYWMYRGDESYLKTLLPAYRSVLGWYEQFLKPNGSLGYIPYWFFVDWAKGFTYGAPTRDKDGNSAMQDIMFILALDYVSKMENYFGIPAMGAHYRSIANKMRSTYKEKYWDTSRNLFADTFDKKSFSQHTNALAILADIVSGEEAKTVMTNLLEDKEIIQATIYFKYYVNQALKKAGMGNLLLDNIQTWKNQIDLGLTTWAETPEPSRSDCHAWGASPNIEFYRIILGIDTDAPGFRKVCINPSLNGIKKISGTIPHPEGEISVSYDIDDKNTLTANISIPKSIEGIFIWDNKSYFLKGGKQTFVIRK